MAFRCPLPRPHPCSDSGWCHCQPAVTYTEPDPISDSEPDPGANTVPDTVANPEPDSEPDPEPDPVAVSTDLSPAVLNFAGGSTSGYCPRESRRN